MFINNGIDSAYSLPLYNIFPIISELLVNTSIFTTLYYLQKKMSKGHKIDNFKFAEGLKVLYVVIFLLNLLTGTAQGFKGQSQIEKYNEELKNIKPFQWHRDIFLDFK
jgi:hypothetical protein